MKQNKYSLIILCMILLNIFLVNIKWTKENTFHFENDIEQKLISVSELHKNKIKIYYPKSNYSKLNKQIDEKIKNLKTDFEEKTLHLEAPKNEYYTLNINYEEYRYKHYLSYLFSVEENTGGVHPSHQLWSIIFDTKKEEVVTLDYLIEKKENILNIFSKISQEELIINPKITTMEMLIDGTKPRKENFQNLVFTNDGILLLFPHYQVAPYSQGQFEVLIPWKMMY